MRFTVSLLAAVVLAIQANAQQIIAFSGDTCNGGQGGEVPCDGTCFDFTGRHSYEVSSADFLNQGNADVDYRFLVPRHLSPSSRAAIALDRSFPLARPRWPVHQCQHRDRHQYVQLHPGLSAEGES
ncbi:hypothetical protein B0H13DRAFT_1599926 [Mycena leptocephala]|nr:hypothetical protein B0H13DRAFT_1599926 [Mycena leptocephala]